MECESGRQEQSIIEPLQAAYIAWGAGTLVKQRGKCGVSTHYLGGSL